MWVALAIGLVGQCTWPRVGVADEAGSDTIPNAAGGEGGHGVAKLDPVIHRHILKCYRIKPQIYPRHLTKDSLVSNNNSGSHAPLLNFTFSV